MLSVISCVGMRPLAVISPISALVQTKKLVPQNLEILLFATDVTGEKAKRCRSYFEERYPGASVQILPLHKEIIREVIHVRTERKDHIYFNVDPGMNWSVALIAYFLPSTATCIYADFSKLYEWKIDEEPSKENPIDLIDLGLDTYNRFSEGVIFEKKEGINEALSENIKSFLRSKGLQSRIEVHFKSQMVPSWLENYINNRIVYAFEKYAMIYLLFDFQVDEKFIPVEEKGFKEKQKEISELYRKLYRAVTDIFDPSNFSITVITNLYQLKERALSDGYEVIWTPKDEKWRERLSRWIEGQFKMRPKSVVHFKHLANPETSMGISEKGKALFVCLGDNVTPTLKAILSHRANTVYLFYDTKSGLISSLAKNIRDLFVAENLGNILLVPTDNVGRGMVQFVRERARLFKDYQINLTPGTKAQTVALTRAAKLIGGERNLFTIYSRKTGETIARLIDGESLYPVNAPSPELIIKSHLLKFKDASEPPNVDAFRQVMIGLAEEKISGDFSKILKLRVSGKPVFRKLGYLNGTDRVRLSCLLDKKEYELDRSLVEGQRAGVWWEAAVAYAIQRALEVKVMWSAKWDWPVDPKEKFFLSELDVVFGWRNLTCVVSCKTGREGFNPLTRYEVRSESRKRFDRFTLPFIAVPWNEFEGKNYAGLIEDGVMYLTPSLLAFPERLEAALTQFASSRKTT